jgi:transcriptional regulator with XRE-family HTH domain
MGKETDGSGLEGMYDFSFMRELRRRESLSIGALSELSGVSPAVISKLERNRTAAGLDTIFRLSRVLGMNPSDMLALAESHSAQKALESSHESGGFKFRHVQYGNVRCLLGVCKKGAKLSRPEIHNEDYELCWTVEGSVKFSLPHETHILKQGEAVQFDALMEHSYEAVEDSKIIIVRVRKPKRF